METLYVANNIDTLRLTCPDLASFCSTSVRQSSLQTQEVSSGQQQLNRQLTAAVIHMIRQIEASQPVQNELMGLLGHFRQAVLAPASVTAASGYKDYQFSGEIDSRNDAVKYKSIKPSLYIQALRTVNLCRRECPCKCHARRRIYVPRSIERLVGRGYVCVNDLSLIKRGCSLESCKGPTAPQVEVRYLIPTWIAMRMIYISFTSSPSHSPEFVARLPRVVESENSGLEAVFYGNIELLKSAIEKGECIPNDVDEFGLSLLQVCASY